MSKQLMISMLQKGNTGIEILSILDALISDNIAESDVKEPTLDVIDF